jgi:predicted dehydrogenase
VTVNLEIGIVGCGRLAEVGYLPALAHVRGARVVAVADPDATRRARIARLAGPGVREHADLSSLLADRRPDALVVATPVEHHLADATAASDAGVPALLEKPPAPDAATAAALASLANPPWLGFNRRFDPHAARARAALRAHHGDVELELELRYRRRSWSAVHVADDALLDLGPHLVDWARWITGDDLDRVRGLEIGPERAVVLARSARGPVRMTARTDHTYRERIEARDRDGRVVVRQRRGDTFDNLRSRLPGAAHPLVATLAAELHELVGAVRGVTPVRLATAADGLAVMQVIDAARASAAAGRAAVTPAGTRPPSET